MKRLQLLIPDKRADQLDLIAEIRGIIPSTALRMLAMDAIEAEIKRIRGDYPLYRDAIMAIEVKYSVR
jgi:hypothetical protein